MTYAAIGTCIVALIVAVLIALFLRGMLMAALAPLALS